MIIDDDDGDDDDDDAWVVTMILSCLIIALYCDTSVCLSVCLSGWLFQYVTEVSRSPRSVTNGLL